MTPGPYDQVAIKVTCDCHGKRDLQSDPSSGSGLSYRALR